VLLLLAPNILWATSEAAPKSRDLLVEIEDNFPAAKKWFGMVGDLEWSRDAHGSLTPRFETLHSNFVIRRDPAGQSLGATLPPHAGGPVEVWVHGSRNFSVRTEEIGVPPVAAQVVRGVVVYRGAVAGGDLLYKLTPTHVDEYVYFRSPPPALTRVFEFDHGGQVGQLRDTGGHVEVLGKDGVARLRLSAPFARAADGTRRQGTVRLEGRKVILDIDLTGLKAPVLVDPDWSTTGSMTTPHWGDAAFLRADNRVMAVGGCALAGCPNSFTQVFCAQVLAATDVWDETQGTWTSGQPMLTARYLYASTPLPGGDFLVAGGCTTTGCATTTALAERYDATSGGWAAAGRLRAPAANGAAASLPGGDAIVVGGCNPQGCTTMVERYQASTNGFVPAAPLAAALGFATATPLANGEVLVVGGCADPLCATVLNTAWRYDPAADQWHTAGSMTVPRAAHTATVLPDGRVLVLGGCGDGSCTQTHSTAEAWTMDPGGGSFGALPSMQGARHNHTATLLSNGGVLVAGGLSSAGATTPMAEVFLPLANYWWDTSGMLMDRAYHVAVALPGGDVVVGGGCNPATCMPWAEVFEGDGVPANVDGGVPPPRPDAGTTSQDGGPPRVYTAESPHPPLFRTGQARCGDNTTQGLVCPIPGFGLEDGQFQPNQRVWEERNGEVFDPVTGLSWQQNDDGALLDQAGAAAHCAAFSTPATPAGVWRLPSVVELLTINNYGAMTPSTAPVFHGTQSTNYWTSTVIPSAIRLAWTVKFDFGEVIPLLIDTTLPVRCVHGPPITSGSSPVRLAGPFTSTQDTVIDARSELEWQREDDGVKRTWQDSLEYCAALNLDGKTGWHLPNILELVGLVEYVHNLFTPAIDPVFRRPHSDLYWVSTYNEGVPTLAWSVTFNLGVVDGVTVGGRAYARCVRHLEGPAPGDGGVGDAGAILDAGTVTDAGAALDAGAAMDSGTSTQPPGRCGCGVAQVDGAAPGALLLLWLGWARLRRQSGKRSRAAVRA